MYAYTFMLTFKYLHIHIEQGWESTEEADPMWDLLNRLLDFNPNNRITAAEALDHPWFKS